MDKHIIYIPLDERPCNLLFPRYIAEIGAAHLTTPPKELLGQFKTPAHVEALWDWLLAQPMQESYLILSMDMLLYGGIVPSRLHHLPQEVCTARLEKLRLLSAKQIYAFQLITRAPARNGSGEEPDYYETHGYDIFRYGVITDKESVNKATQEELAEKQGILQRVPQTNLQDFLARRACNFANNEKMLALAAQQVVDHFVIPLDDCFEYGYAPAERRRLAKTAAELGILSRIAMYPGADEMGCTLVARALCHMAGVRPRIYMGYSSETGRMTTPAYEDRSICETAPQHILCAGGRVTQFPQEADAFLMIHPPTAFSNRIKFELDRRQLYLEPERNLNEFTEKLLQYIESGKPVALADCAVPDGADECLMQFLTEQNVLPQLAAFSGWNTSSNAMGTAVAHAMALCAAGEKSNQALSQTFRNLRYLEDWAYMTHVRQDTNDKVLAGAFGEILDVRYLQQQTTSIAAEITQQLQAFAKERLPFVSGIPQADLPWQRLFEITLTLQKSFSKKAL